MQGLNRAAFRIETEQQLRKVDNLIGLHDGRHVTVVYGRNVTHLLGSSTVPGIDFLCEYKRLNSIRRIHWQM